jgi:hypothetical protein
MLEWLERSSFRRMVRQVRFRLEHADLFRDALQHRRLERFLALIEGKSIALVGNAQSLLGKPDGGVAIDACEVVIRMNRGFIRDPLAQGTRTDVMMISGGISLKEIQASCDPGIILYMTPKRITMSADLFGDQRITCLPFDVWRALRRELGARPSTGMMGLYLLTRIGRPASVNLFGFDWKESKTFYKAREPENPTHDWDRERQVILEWVRQQPGKLNLR